MKVRLLVDGLASFSEAGGIVHTRRVFKGQICEFDDARAQRAVADGLAEYVGKWTRG